MAIELQEYIGSIPIIKDSLKDNISLNESLIVNFLKIYIIILVYQNISIIH